MRPIFIVGIPRSGTTWLHSLIGGHPDCILVTPYSLGLSRLDQSRESRIFLRNLSDDQIRRLIENVAREKIPVEKTPRHLMVLPRIRRVFPEARIVLIRRNKEDVIHSMLQPMTFWPSHPKTRFKAERLYRDLRRAQDSFRGYDVTVRYEELWADPLGELARIYAELELDPSPAAEVVRANERGRSLPPRLKSVFRVGEPGAR